MGAFVIMDVGFESKKDRKKFEKKYDIKKKQVLVDEHTPCFATAWTYLRNPYWNPIYDMGFLGYGDPKEILKECLKEKIKIRFLAWIPINDKDSKWEKLRGRW